MMNSSETIAEYSGLKSASGGWHIMHDPDLLAEPLSPMFDPDWWRERGRLAGQASGRGAVWFVESENTTWALRHYRRGGLVGRVIDDHYLYTGHDRVRSMAEFRVTTQLAKAGLPVPQPVAGAYRRLGPWYTADLITVAIPSAQTLTERLLADDVDDSHWLDVGHCIARFHDRGLNHADLNAHNILFDAKDRVWLIDFDRARIEPRGDWCEGNLARLLRSLNKVCSEHKAIESGWHLVNQGYRRGVNE